MEKKYALVRSDGYIGNIAIADEKDPIVEIFGNIVVPDNPEDGLGPYRIGDYYINGEFVRVESNIVEPDIESIRTEKLSEIGIACTAAIYAGVEVNGYRYSLTEHDQIELMAQQSAVMSGALAAPYHADGELCRMYPASEFMEIATMATAHIFYHRTYCNHLNAWIRRTEDVGELEAITYGTELPDDLAENMALILLAAGG